MNLVLVVSFQVNGDIPPRLKKSAHEIILDFIRSRPPLNPVCDLSVPLGWRSRSNVLSSRTWSLELSSLGSFFTPIFCSQNDKA